MNLKESSDSSEQEDTKEENLKKMNINLIIISKIIKEEGGEFPCICSNISIEEVENIIKNNNNNNDTNIYLEKEIVPEVEVRANADDKVLFKDIVEKLRTYGYPIQGSHFSIYIEPAMDFVYVGSEPIDADFYLDSDLVDFQNIQLKLVAYIEDKFIKKIEKDTISKYSGDSNLNKKTKERKIEFIIEKVNQWRKLYNGCYNSLGEYTRYSLDEAANIVGISKKSMDDYLLQLRLGRKYGFDFNANKNEKVGVLRNFVRSKKDKSGKNNKENK